MTGTEVQTEIKRLQQYVDEVSTKTEQANQISQRLFHICDQHYLTKFERIQRKFMDTVDQWVTDEHKHAKIIGRKPDQSVYRKCEETRAKKECVTLLDELIPPNEKLGSRLWQDGLRNNLDRRTASQMSLKQQVEIIRKPSSSNLKSRFEGKQPYQSFTSGQYVQNKLKEHDDSLKDIIEGDPNQMADLEIIGCNIMKLEATSLSKQLTQDQKLEQQKFVRCIAKAEEGLNGPINTEIVQVHWNRKDLLRSGKFALAKKACMKDD